MPSGTFPRANAFIGFSGYSGSVAGASLEVILSDVEVLNFDTQTMAQEAASDMLAEDSTDFEKSEWFKTLHEDKRFATQASQKEAVERLTKLLKEHVDRFDGLGEKLKQDIVKMESRLDTLGADIATYLAAAQSFQADTGTMDPQAVKEHIVGIRSMLTKGQEQHDAKLDALAGAAQELKSKGGAVLSGESKAKVESLHAQAKAVQDYAHKGTTQGNSMLLVLVVAVFALGCLFLNRMQYYEKKHYI